MSRFRPVFSILIVAVLLTGCQASRDPATEATASGEYLFCFWNLENFFDDKLDGWTDKPDKEYDAWFAENPKVLREKLNHLSEALIEMNGGIVPRTRKELERLPGIGPYTASAVLALVYGRAEPLLDVYMARLLGRFLGPPEGIEAKRKRTLHALALRLVRSKHGLEVNWAVLDFGALVCRARRPLCPECPLRARATMPWRDSSSLLPAQVLF